MIPWDWGYASLTYNTDHVDPADATGWELAWNPKYKGKISLWDGAASNLEVAALKLGYGKQMDTMSSDQLNNAKQALIEQKPLNKFYWQSEYNDMQPALKSDTVWIAYSWQDTVNLLNPAGKKAKFVFLDPSQGRLSWFCGFMLGKDTQNYRHAHQYVESFINRKACADMTSNYYYGTANTTVTADDIGNPALAKSLDLGNPKAIAAPDVHLQSLGAQPAGVRPGLGRGQGLVTVPSARSQHLERGGSSCNRSGGGLSRPPPRGASCRAGS